MILVSGAGDGRVEGARALTKVPNCGGSVLDCIEADFRDERFYCMFSGCTRWTRVGTAQDSMFAVVGVIPQCSVHFAAFRFCKVSLEYCICESNFIEVHFIFFVVEYFTMC